MEAGFCGGFVAQWFLAALVRHPGFESRGCRFFAFLLSLSAGWIPINIRNLIKYINFYSAEISCGLKFNTICKTKPYKIGTESFGSEDL